MKLTNKQLEIVVSEIFDKVSKPIIDSNNKLLESVEIPKTQYLKDLEIYRALENQIESIKEQMNRIADEYKNIEIDGYIFSRWYPMDKDSELKYKQHLRRSKIELKEYPTKADIEKQVILAGNKDIPALIETLVDKLYK